MQTQQEIFAFADRFMAALDAGDAGRVREFYAPGATVWHNFDNVDQPLDENLKLLEWMVRKAPSRRYRVLRRELVPGGWFQQHVLEAELPGGRSMTLYACCVITLKDGLIRRIEEYVDPAQAAVLRELKTA
jgi:ketosteroid isomerase-like protein